MAALYATTVANAPPKPKTKAEKTREVFDAVTAAPSHIRKVHTIQDNTIITTKADRKDSDIETPPHYNKWDDKAETYYSKTVHRKENPIFKKEESRFVRGDGSQENRVLTTNFPNDPAWTKPTTSLKPSSAVSVATA